MHGGKHSRVGQRVSRAASGAQLLGLGPLLGNDIFVNKIGKALSAKPSACSLWLRQQL